MSTQRPRSNSSTRVRRTKNSRAGQQHRRKSPNLPKVGGMHHRRDKRFPMATPRATPEDVAATQDASKEPPDSDPLDAWRKVVMLWLSWNSSQEKLTAKMCKPGQDQRKLELMMDEMEQLRRRAVAASEAVLTR